MPKAIAWNEKQCLYCPKCKKVVECTEKSRGHGGDAPSFRCPKRHKFTAWSFLRDIDVDEEIGEKRQEACQTRTKLLTRLRRRGQGMKPNSRTADWNPNQEELDELHLRGRE